ncbi:B12-binding domain-containing radical SAM protein [Mucilaginibacter sp. KACC 22063]|uniref:B12-binding domain-containing radical SAM protein n=1 Tax=Mucilaginibacter sp. KACC 22063 TaxID=3025666 RepID=UPI002365BED8|nr:radical SAM protein [Mucilaginibacter sp. KACC 22063]WDF53808.1 radical SAM protein [Mucilaginibacter sp. KACC 22063]
MGEKVLLTHSYFLRFDQKQWETGQPYPPLATLIAAAIMRDKGYEVDFFDTMFAFDANDVENALYSQSPKYFVVYDDCFNYLTKMCLTNMREAAFEMFGLAKKYGAKVIVASSDATDRHLEYLKQGADFVILGEADDTLPDLLNTLDTGRDVSEVKGIAFLDNGQLIKTSARPVIRDLDRLPFAAWDLLDVAPYREMWMKSKSYFALNMGTTRGCPFKCNWCAKPIYGNRYNSRSPEHVVEELSIMKQRFNFDYIWFCDDIFGLKPGWVETFSRLVKEYQLDFKFKIQSRADLLTEDKEVKALADAGCDNAWIGAESGSQKILDAMDKGTTIEQIHTATHLLKKHGIKPSFFIQFGYPGETKADIMETVAMINRLLPYEIGISVSYPLPGTIFYERVQAQLKQKTNWTDSDEMALMFKNTYPAGFYKQLHKYVHQNYHRNLALNGLANLFKAPLKADKKTFKKAASLIYHTPATWIERLKLLRAERATL